MENEGKIRENGEKMTFGNYSKDKFRVRSPVKSFRDLEVYQKTIQLSSEIAQFDEKLREMAERIPQLIAEAYGDKYDSKAISHQKLTEATTLITDIITKIDILREKFKDDAQKKEILDKLLSRYHTQKIKVLNLRKAWDRVYIDSSRINEAK